MEIDRNKLRYSQDNAAAEKALREAGIDRNPDDPRIALEILQGLQELEAVRLQQSIPEIGQTAVLGLVEPTRRHGHYFVH